MKLYIAGKVSKESVFGTHHWRDKFVAELASLSGLELSHLDPLAFEASEYDPQKVFDKDCWLISQADCVVVYLSDDISVGGSQEMLIAKYFKKPLLGFAPYGGKFLAHEKIYMGKTVKDFVDPFVYASCDKVCGNLEQVAEVLRSIGDVRPKTIKIIDEAAARASEKNV